MKTFKELVERDKKRNLKKELKQAMKQVKDGTGLGKDAYVQSRRLGWITTNNKTPVT